MNFKRIGEEYLKNGWLWLLVLSALFVSLGLFLPNNKLQLNSKLLLLILSGLCSGLFYGVNNNVVFHHPYERNFYKKHTPTLKDLKVFPGISELSSIAQIHIFWVHIISGIIGSIALYLLLIRVPTIDVFITKDMWWLNFILLLIAILGYVGYIPRTLWFFASKGGVGMDRPS